MKRKGFKRNPRNEGSNRCDFRPRLGAIESLEKLNGDAKASDYGIEDTLSRKRARFLDQGANPSLESEPRWRAECNTASGSAADAPKTSEFAFFRKLKQDAGQTSRPVPKNSNSQYECRAIDCPEINNIVWCGFQNLKSSFLREDVRPRESYPTPVAAPSKTPRMNDMTDTNEDNLKNLEFPYPIKNSIPVNFEISSSPFRDPVRTSDDCGYGGIFSRKREKLFQLVANTYPEFKDLNLKGSDVASALLGRLFPRGYDSQHARRALKLILPDDRSTPRSHVLFDNYVGFEELQWTGSGCIGTREAGDLMVLDDLSTGSKELLAWDNDYRTSSDSHRDKRYTHCKTKEPHHNFDRGRCRSPQKRLHSYLPYEASESHTSDFDVCHPDVFATRGDRVLSWDYEPTDNEDELQLVPQKFDCGKTQFSTFKSSWKSEYLHVSSKSRLPSFYLPPQFASDHWYSIDRNCQALEENVSFAAPDHLLEDNKNYSQDIVDSHRRDSWFTTEEDSSKLPFVQPHLLSTPYTISIEATPCHFRELQQSSIDHPTELRQRDDIFSYNLYHDYGSHRHPQEAYRIGLAEERKPITDYRPYNSQLMTSFRGNVPDTTPEYHFSNRECEDMVYMTGKIEPIQCLPSFCTESKLL